MERGMHSTIRFWDGIWNAFHHQILEWNMECVPPSDSGMEYGMRSTIRFWDGIWNAFHQQILGWNMECIPSDERGRAVGFLGILVETIIHPWIFDHHPVRGIVDMVRSVPAVSRVHLVQVISGVGVVLSLLLLLLLLETPRRDDRVRGFWNGDRKRWWRLSLQSRHTVLVRDQQLVVHTLRRGRGYATEGTPVRVRGWIGRRGRRGRCASHLIISFLTRFHHLVVFVLDVDSVGPSQFTSHPVLLVI